MYKIRIKNEMHGYERDEIVLIEAKNHIQALEIAQQKDIFAVVSLIEELIE